MSTPSSENPDFATLQSPDFSLVLGGPLYQLWHKAHLAGSTLELVSRRIIASIVITWVPLLLLSLAEGNLWAGKVAVPFLHDIEMHIRLLVAVPMLIVAELLVNQRMRPMVGQFSARNLIPPSAQPEFNTAITTAMRLRNSVPAELSLIAIVYVVGVGFVWRTQVALDVSSWYGAAEAGILQPSLAGWWMACVSIPVFQFLLLRWYFRLFIWARFLWHVSRLDLQLMAMHPDRCGGLGFIAGVSDAFKPVLLAQGVLLSGAIANKIFFGGAKLIAFKVEIIGLVATMVLAILGPMLCFIPVLAACKRTGTREYGILAHQYVREFDHKWLRGGAAKDEHLLGSGDVQSLADLGNSFAVVKEMRLIPFNMQTVLQLALTTLAPIAPLLLTVVPLEQLLDQLLKLVF